MDITVQDPLVGQVLDGRYRVEGRIAVGGMATVYRAVDTRLDRLLALKVMHPGLAADTGFVDRFIREAKAVARLAHPNVVGVFDQGTDGTYVYLAMEYVAGCTLRDVLRGRGALQPRAALDILEPVLAALGAAHRAGLIHRDMKPENVLIGDAGTSHAEGYPGGYAGGRVKVADFGLVRAVDTQTSAGSGSLLGTVSYLAPEQMGHGTVDQRTDVYACGLVLYEMLTGRKPYDGDTAVKVMFQHLNEDVPAPSATVPSVAPQLDALVARAAARHPRARPADAVELLAEVRAVRAVLTPGQLDEQPADAMPAGSEEPTSVVPLPVPPVLPVPPEPDEPRPLPQPVPTGVLGPAEPSADHEPSASPDPGGPSAFPDPGGLNRTARLATPDVPPAEPPAGPGGHEGGPRRNRRGVLAVLLVLLALAGVGAGIWYIGDGRFTKVPGVLALAQADAQKKLSSAGLGTKVTRDFSLTVPRGSVISTDPAPGERIRSNGTVTLTVSRGPKAVRVPDVRGRALATARKEIKDAGLTPGTVTKAFSDDVPNGQVISTDPAAATDRAPGTPVSVTLSRGAPVEVPDVIGDSVTDAQQALQDAGLTVVLAPGKVFSDEADKDTVALESPDKGTQAGSGDTVTITVSQGPQMFDVPDVEGKSEGDAKRILKDAGFDVRVINVFFGDTVLSQSPGGGQAPKGATITIWVR